MIEKRRITDQLTEDELIKALEKVDSEQDLVKKLQDDVLNFIVKFGIKPGKFKIKTNLLYHVYKNWSTEPVNKRTFVYTLKLYVDVKSESSLINVSAFKFTEEAYKTLKKELKPKKDSLANKRRHFESFLKHFDIQRAVSRVGRVRMHVGAFYYLYDIFCYETGYKEHLLTFTQLQSFLNLYLQPIRNRLGYSYFIKKAILDENKTRTALEWYVHQGRQHEKKKKNKTKQS